MHYSSNLVFDCFYKKKDYFVLKKPFSNKIREQNNKVQFAKRLFEKCLSATFPNILFKIEAKKRKMSNEQASSEAQVQNDMILKQKEAIEKEIQASHQLIDVIEEVKVLETQFCNDPTFLKNAIQLQVCLHIL